MLRLAEIKDLLKIMPLGKVPRYNQELETIGLTDTTARRFVNDRSILAGVARTELSAQGLDPLYLSFGISEALQVLVNKNYPVYLKMMQIILDADYSICKNFGNSYEQAMILFCHSSFGERLFPHIHQRRSKNPTLSLFLNLSNLNTTDLILLPEVDKSSKLYDKGYTDHRVILRYEKQNKDNSTRIKINNKTAIIFNADTIPHSMDYTNDLWMVMVYDNINIYESVKIENQFSRYDNTY